MGERRRPGEVRDAILTVLQGRPGGASVGEIVRDVSELVGYAAPSSVRSYLRLNTPSVFVRTERGRYELKEARSTYRDDKVESEGADWDRFNFGRTVLVKADCFEWLRRQQERSIHAVVTDPPYGLYEYSSEQQEKLRAGKGGVWRIPPSFDGSKRSPLPRFTILRRNDLEAIE